MSKEVNCHEAQYWTPVTPVVHKADYDALLAERDALRDALEQAAQSLESISKLAGRDEFMQDALDIRGFANSRATVARAALQGEQP